MSIEKITREMAESIRRADITQEWTHEQIASIKNVPVEMVKTLCKYGDKWHGYEQIAFVE